MKEISLHLLDLAENSTAAGATCIQIRVVEDLDADQLSAEVTDNGIGMDAETVRKVIDPFFSSRKTRRIGLGVPLLKEAAEAANGALVIHSKPGEGTRISVCFQHSHIDRMPLGNLAITFLELLAMHPEVHWFFIYTARNGAVTKKYELDDRPIKKTIGELPLTHPEVLTFLRENLENGLAAVRETLKPQKNKERKCQQ